jgi:hypothetical protein
MLGSILLNLSITSIVNPSAKRGIHPKELKHERLAEVFIDPTLAKDHREIIMRERSFRIVVVADQPQIG